MIMFYFYLLLLFISISFSNCSKQSTIGCELDWKETKHVYEGWPTKMSCKDLVAVLRRKTNFRLEGVGNLTCIIVDPANNRTVWSQPMNKATHFNDPEYYTPDITQLTPKNYQVNIKPSNTTCYYTEVELNVTKQQNESCVGNQKIHPLLTVQGNEGQLKSMECSAPYEMDHKIDLNDDIHTYDVVWYRNCTELHPEKQPHVYRVVGKQLTIMSLSFDAVGIYSCKITYNGKTRHPIAFSVCAKPPEYTSKPTIRCPDVVKAKIGDTAKITCNVNVGQRSVNLVGIFGTWQQANRNKTFSCQYYSGSTFRGWHGRAICYSNVSQDHNDKCYLYEPTVFDQTPIENILNITLELSDIQAADFGEISVRYRDFMEEVTGTITLKFESVFVLSGYMYTVIVLSVIVGILVIVVLILIFRRISRRISSDPLYYKKSKICNS